MWVGSGNPNPLIDEQITMIEQWIADPLSHEHLPQFRDAAVTISSSSSESATVRGAVSGDIGSVSESVTGYSIDQDISSQCCKLAEDSLRRGDYASAEVFLRNLLAQVENGRSFDKSVVMRSQIALVCCF